MKDRNQTMEITSEEDVIALTKRCLELQDEVTVLNDVIDALRTSLAIARGEIEVPDEGEFQDELDAWEALSDEAWLVSEAGLDEMPDGAG
jgi:hypothetical protein